MSPGKRARNNEDKEESDISDSSEEEVRLDPQFMPPTGMDEVMVMIDKLKACLSTLVTGKDNTDAFQTTNQEQIQAFLKETNLQTRCTVSVAKDDYSNMLHSRMQPEHQDPFFGREMSIEPRLSSKGKDNVEITSRFPKEVTNKKTYVIVQAEKKGPESNAYAEFTLMDRTVFLKNMEQLDWIERLFRPPGDNGMTDPTLRSEITALLTHQSLQTLTTPPRFYVSQETGLCHIQRHYNDTNVKISILPTTWLKALAKTLKQTIDDAPTPERKAADAARARRQLSESLKATIVKAHDVVQAELRNSSAIDTTKLKSDINTLKTQLNSYTGNASKIKQIRTFVDKLETTMLSKTDTPRPVDILTAMNCARDQEASQVARNQLPISALAGERDPDTEFRRILKSEKCHLQGLVLERMVPSISPFIQQAKILFDEMDHTRDPELPVELYTAVLATHIYQLNVSAEAQSKIINGCAIVTFLETHDIPRYISHDIYSLCKTYPDTFLPKLKALFKLKAGSHEPERLDFQVETNGKFKFLSLNRWIPRKADLDAIIHECAEIRKAETSAQRAAAAAQAAKFAGAVTRKRQALQDE